MYTEKHTILQRVCLSVNTIKQIYIVYTLNKYYKTVWFNYQTTIRNNYLSNKEKVRKVKWDYLPINNYSTSGWRKTHS